MKNYLNYLLNIESNALSWLWASLSIYIALGLITSSVIVSVLFMIHVFVIMAITGYQVYNFFQEIDSKIKSN